MATVVKRLTSIDSELTAAAPKRTLPTWYAGDAAHKTRPSGHNPDDTPGSKAEYQDSDNIAEIRAGDYRLPLNAKFSAEAAVQLLVKQCRANAIDSIQYIIFNRRIWSESTGWVTRAYTGSNPHDKHFHISVKPETVHENDTKKIGFESLNPKPAPPKPNPSPALPVFKNGSRQNSKSKNNRGTDVATLQRFVGAKDTGSWNSETEREVRAYQDTRGLKVDGIAGPKTWAPILRAIR
jgi:hypothetical protein